MSTALITDEEIVHLLINRWTAIVHLNVCIPAKIDCVCGKHPFLHEMYRRDKFGVTMHQTMNIEPRNTYGDFEKIKVFGNWTWYVSVSQLVGSEYVSCIANGIEVCETLQTIRHRRMNPVSTPRVPNKISTIPYDAELHQIIVCMSRLIGISGSIKLRHLESIRSK